MVIVGHSEFGDLFWGLITETWKLKTDLKAKRNDSVPNLARRLFQWRNAKSLKNSKFDWAQGSLIKARQRL